MGTAPAATFVLLLGAAFPLASYTSAAADTSAGAGTLFVVPDTSGCSDQGSGTLAQPFCTIIAAAAAVQPGQTVLIEPGQYDYSNAHVTITRSGTSAAPITFKGNSWRGDRVDVAGGITISGAQHVTISGISATASTTPAYQVEGSSDVTIEQGNARSTSGPDIDVDGSSSDVTIRRMSMGMSSFGDTGVRIDSGATGVTVASSTSIGEMGFVATDAPGTVITGNTLVTNCRQGIELDGASTGSTVENNIVETASQASGVSSPSACAATADATAVSVAAGSTSGTTVDDNIVDPAAGGSLYEWAGTGYADSAAFTAATGQGTDDISANPQLSETADEFGDLYAPTVGSPAVDSADADAPGETGTDLLGNPRQDDPSVGNSPTGYFDRGAVELQGPQSSAGVSVRQDGLHVTITPTHPTPTWTTNGPVDAPYTYAFDDDPGFTTGPEFPVTTDAGLDHTFARAGTHQIEWWDNQGNRRTIQVVLGADYTPVAPTRLLDTRHAIGVTTTTPVAAGATLDLRIPSIAGVPAADISAITANVTVTQPTAAGHLTVFPDTGGTVPTASNLNFTKGQTVPNLVTVAMGNGTIGFHNASSGTVHLVVDLEGFYCQGGNGFKPQSPTRVLDTRSGLGTTSAEPIAPHSSVVLDLSGKLPAGATAAVVNLTVTRPTENGFVTAYPYGQSEPNASNVNFTTGQTVANLAVIPVSNGKLVLTNNSGGTTQLVADLEGYFGTAASGADQAYVPDGPQRLADTRQTSPVPANGTLHVTPRTQTGCTGTCPKDTAAVLNLTVTQPQSSGVITAYPAGSSLPTASNLNFTAGQTVPNLASVIDTGLGIDIHNHSTGSVQLVVDEEGYYTAPQTVTD